MKTNSRGMAIAGLICGLLGLLVTIVMVGIGIAMAVSDMNQNGGF